jgi:hypothetical protein
MARRPLLIVLAIAALVLPGCVATLPNAPQAGDATPIATGYAPTTHTNLWLLDGPRPALETRVSTGGAEPAILADSQGRAILVGDNVGVYRSTDAGATWKRVIVPYVKLGVQDVATPAGSITGGQGIISDGWVFAQDADGMLYASTTNGAIINVARSADGGATWDTTPSTYVVDAGPIADRPWLAARGHGEVAMIWNVGGSSESCSYSTDAALTFPHRGVPSTSSAGLPIGGRAEFDSAGRLYYFGNGGGTMYRYDQAPCSNLLQKVALPAHGAQLSLQATTDTTGHVYSAVPTSGNGAMQIWGWNGTKAASLKTLTVSGPTLQGNTFGTIHQQGDEIVVAWYGTETGGNFLDPTFAGEWNVYVAQVRDFWTASPTIVVTRVTTVPNHVGGFCFGGTTCDTGTTPGDRDLLDYFQVTHDAQGNAHVAYAHDGTTSNVEVRYAKVNVSAP